MKPKPDQARINADFEFFDRKSRRVEFLYQDPWRVLRIQSDLIQSIETMARSLEDSQHVVAVFGSARKSASDQYCESARELCRQLAWPNRRANCQQQQKSENRQTGTPAKGDERPKILV